MKKMILRMLKKLNADPVANKEEIAELTAELAELEKIEADEEEAKKKKKEDEDKKNVKTDLELEIEKMKEDAKTAEAEKLALMQKLKDADKNKVDPINDAIKKNEERLAEIKIKERELEYDRKMAEFETKQNDLLAKITKSEKVNKLLEAKNKITALKLEKPYLANQLDKITLEGDNVTDESIASELTYVLKFSDEEKLKAEYEAKDDKNPWADKTDLKDKKDIKKDDKKVVIPKEIEGDKLDEVIDLIAEKIGEDPNFMDNLYMQD